MENWRPKRFKRERSLEGRAIGPGTPLSGGIFDERGVSSSGTRSGGTSYLAPGACLPRRADTPGAGLPLSSRRGREARFPFRMLRLPSSSFSSELNPKGSASAERGDVFHRLGLVGADRLGLMGALAPETGGGSDAV